MRCVRESDVAYTHANFRRDYSIFIALCNKKDDAIKGLYFFESSTYRRIKLMTCLKA